MNRASGVLIVVAALASGCAPVLDTPQLAVPNELISSLIADLSKRDDGRVYIKHNVGMERNIGDIVIIETGRMLEDRCLSFKSMRRPYYLGSSVSRSSEQGVSVSLPHVYGSAATWTDSISFKYGYHEAEEEMVTDSEIELFENTKPSCLMKAIGRGKNHSVHIVTNKITARKTNEVTSNRDIGIGMPDHLGARYNTKTEVKDDDVRYTLALGLMPASPFLDHDMVK